MSHSDDITVARPAVEHIRTLNWSLVKGTLIAWPDDTHYYVIRPEIQELRRQRGSSDYNTAYALELRESPPVKDAKPVKLGLWPTIDNAMHEARDHNGSSEPEAVKPAPAYSFCVKCGRVAPAHSTWCEDRSPDRPE